MLSDITPIVISYNEQENIERMLNQLAWAKKIILVDSFSDDKTLEIAQKYKNVEIFQRKFDNFSEQRNYALSKVPDNESSWVLYMDADYIMTDDLKKEIEQLHPADEFKAFIIPFKFCIFGKPLKASLYPAKSLLFSKKEGKFIQEGHHEVAQVQGCIGRLKAPMLHDDRKPIKRWLDGQLKYAEEEAQRLTIASAADLSAFDRIRKLKFLAPLIVFPYCLIFKGLVFDGWRGFYYSCQRFVYELVLTLVLIQNSIEGTSDR